MTHHPDSHEAFMAEVQAHRDAEAAEAERETLARWQAAGIMPADPKPQALSPMPPLKWPWPLTPFEEMALRKTAKFVPVPPTEPVERVRYSIVTNAMGTAIVAERGEQGSQLHTIGLESVEQMRNLVGWLNRTADPAWWGGWSCGEQS